MLQKCFMILNSSQSVHTSHPLDTTPPSRVIDTSRATSPRSASSESKSDKQQERASEQAQLQSEQRMLRELQTRDREVRAHEAAHTAAGGNLVVSGPSFTYQRGPDGRSYAIGGEVQLDVAAVSGDPEATLEKSQQVRQAALAPTNPSPQDFKVAASANQMAARARVDIAIQRREEAQLEEKQKELAAEQGLAGASSKSGEGTDATSLSTASAAPDSTADSRVSVSPLEVSSPASAFNRFKAASSAMSQTESNLAPTNSFSQYA